MKNLRIKIVIGFAGFGILATFIFWAIAVKTGNTQLLLWFCPFSVISIGLDSASIVVGILGWMLIAAVNAALYGVVGVVVSMAFRDSS